MLYQMCCFKNQNAWHMSKNWTSPVPPKPRDIFFNHGAQAPQRSSPAQRKPWKAQHFWMAWFKCMKNSYFTWMIDNIAPNSWKINIATYNTSICFVRNPWNYNKNIAPEHRARQRSWKQLEHFWMYESAKWTITRQILRSNSLNYQMDMDRQSPKHLKLKKYVQYFSKPCKFPETSSHHPHVILGDLPSTATGAWFQDLLEFSETFQSIEAILLGWQRVFHHLRSDVKLDGWMTKSILIGSMYGVFAIVCTYTFGWILRVICW